MSPSDPRNLFQQRGIKTTDAIHQEYIWMVRGALLNTMELVGPSFRGAVHRSFRKAEVEYRHETTN